MLLSFSWAAADDHEGTITKGPGGVHSTKSGNLSKSVLMSLLQ